MTYLNNVYFLGADRHCSRETLRDLQGIPHNDLMMYGGVNVIMKTKIIIHLELGLRRSSTDQTKTAVELSRDIVKRIAL